MSFQEIIVIWLDETFAKSNYASMTNEFNDSLNCSLSRAAGDKDIDFAICDETKEYLVINGAPVYTVATVDDAITEIEIHSKAKVFFISSGSLGQIAVPRIVHKFPLIHSFYIYCFNMVKHVEWASNYVDCLQMFNHSIDLLVRLMRDISTHFIKQGKLYLDIDDPHNALIYFRNAHNLEIRAQEKDKIPPNTKYKEEHVLPSNYRVNLDLLEGENGLIRQAKNALEKL